VINILLINCSSGKSFGAEHVVRRMPEVQSLAGWFLIQATSFFPVKVPAGQHP